MAREMKDSGIEWIGGIPSTWTVLRTKTLYSHHKTVVGDKSDNYERLALTLNGVIKRSKEDSTGLQPEAFNGYQILRKDELVFKLIDLENISTSRVGLSPYEGLVSPAYIVLEPKENTFSKFGYYHYLSMWHRNIFNHMGDDGVRSSLNASDLLGIPCVVPPLEEQHRIADFLDRKCAEIDRVLEKTRASIEEYKKLKQSVITQAVTKGIRGEREMKDSGIEWIGEIPIDWSIVKITYLADNSHPYAIGDGDHGLIKTTDYLDKGIPYIRVQNIGWGTELSLDNVVFISEEKNEIIKNSIIRPNDILFVKTGATIGKTAIVPDNVYIANTTSHVGKITVSPKYNSRYIFYVLSSYIGYKQMWDYAIQKTTRPELSIEEIRTLRIILPKSFEEQKEICSYLDIKCSEIDTLISKKEQLITELEAYKKSLIYEYVTGKKEVIYG